MSKRKVEKIHRAKIYKKISELAEKFIKKNKDIDLYPKGYGSNKIRTRVSNSKWRYFLYKFNFVYNVYYGDGANAYASYIRKDLLDYIEKSLEKFIEKDKDLKEFVKKQIEKENKN